MMWLNIAKNFLAAYAAKDIDALEKLISKDSTIQSLYGGSTVSSGSHFLEKFKDFSEKFEKIEISLKKTAYNNKTVFIEYEIIHHRKLADDLAHLGARRFDSGVFLFEIDMNKIQSLSNFK